MKKSTPKKPVRRRKSPALIITLALVLVLCAFFGWMRLQASLTRYLPAQVCLADLPRSFEGTKILYISDLKIRSEGDARATIRLMKRLQKAQPDILILGGDYGANSALETLNGTSNGNLNPHAAAFIASLADFYAPMGKFAVAGEGDGDHQALAAAFQASNVNCLSDNSVKISRGSDSIAIAGLSDRSHGRGGSAKLAKQFGAGECVVVAAHNPASYIDIRVSEADGGGAWADLVLSGHTLGGQIRVLGRTLRSFSDEERRTMAGWFYPNDLPLLVSQGLGCDDVRLRLGSQSQVHMLTLSKQEIIS